MSDYILVLNAGSSSLKFCVYQSPDGGAWQLDSRGQIEGIGTAPRFSAKDAAGIQLTALSTNDPGPEQFGKEGAAVARMIHDYLADVVGRYPKRFFALATLVDLGILALVGYAAELPRVVGEGLAPLYLCFGNAFTGILLVRVLERSTPGDVS